jgi:thiol-disulfide isomerase/thioredoxin
MDEIYNHYSFLWVALALTIVAGLVLLTNKPKLRDFLSFGVIIAGLFVSWLILHPQQTALMSDAKAVQAMIGEGTPVLLEFQSPYCIDCSVEKPVVDGLEAELGDNLHIIRINIQDQIGRELGPVYQFEYTPTFIYFDAKGNELWRTIGEIDPQRVRDYVKQSQ